MTADTPDSEERGEKGFVRAGTGRVEAFSDAVFAFAVTLVIVSLEVPKTFDELFETMKGFLSFGCCFGIEPRHLRRMTSGNGDLDGEFAVIQRDHAIDGLHMRMNQGHGSIRCN